MWFPIVVAAVAGSIVSLVRIRTALLRDGFHFRSRLVTPAWVEVYAWIVVLALCGFVVAAALIVHV